MVKHGLDGERMVIERDYYWDGQNLVEESDDGDWVVDAAPDGYTVQIVDPHYTHRTLRILIGWNGGGTYEVLEVFVGEEAITELVAESMMCRIAGAAERELARQAGDHRSDWRYHAEVI